MKEAAVAAEMTSNSTVVLICLHFSSMRYVNNSVTAHQNCLVKTH